MTDNYKNKSEVICIIPHYNNFKGLLRSIRSIDEIIKIDVLIIDDGSNSNLIDESILENSKPKNVNLNIIYNHRNSGIENVLNDALKYIKKNLNNYKFIARLDCGDLNSKNRFKIQADFLKFHRKVGIVGTYVSFIDLEGKHTYNLKLPISHNNIMRNIYINSMFIHPTIMFRKEVLNIVGNYPTKFSAAEDYAFFFEILKSFEGANIPEYLVFCEINPNGISISKRNQQIKSRILIILKNFKFGIYPIYGLIRSFFLLIVPYRIILFIKKLTLK